MKLSPVMLPSCPDHSWKAGFVFFISVRLLAGEIKDPLYIIYSESVHIPRE